MKALIKTIAPAIALSIALSAHSVPALNIFHVGNSITDQSYGMHTIAESLGIAENWTRFMIPGAGWSGCGTTRTRACRTA